MRFSLQDLKKHIQRRGNDLALHVSFLREGDMQMEIGQLISYHERLLDLSQEHFSSDEARACIGDYRLANCLLATMSAWYSWQQRPWGEALHDCDEQAAALLEAAGITSSSQLRLALYTSVNQNQQGFLAAESRAERLEAFAAPFCLSAQELENLLALDHDEQSLLTRITPAPPTRGEVAALYNRWAFEAALFNASSVQLVIDCQKFEAALSTTSQTGVGSIIKRLCYLARKIGVYYDLEYEPVANRAPLSLLRLTLYGPQEMTGAPQQYGLRLARLCRLLLGYNRPAGKRMAEVAWQHQAVIPATAIVEAEANVHFLQRVYRFDVAAALRHLRPQEGDAAPEDERRVGDTALIFDSSIEQGFAEAFAALSQGYGVDGWELAREPEPLLSSQGIFIPDFAMTRGQQRLYVEILGFWTPAYRERKIKKLQQLADRGDIVLAIPGEAREAFGAIAAHFPILWYKDHLSVTELLEMLRTHYDDFAQRMTQLDVEGVRQEVARVGLLPEQMCYNLLHCYRRSELAQAGERIGGNGITFVAGIGLYADNWLERLKPQFITWAKGLGVAPLADVLQESRERWPTLAACPDGTLEALFGLWPEARIHRASIFDATLHITDGEPATRLYEETPLASTVPAKKILRERRAAPRKRVDTEAQQDHLW